MSYRVKMAKQAVRDFDELPPKLKEKFKTIVHDVIAKEPLSGKHLVGELKGYFSLRLSYKDRIVYTIDSRAKVVFIACAKTHYGE